MQNSKIIKTKIQLG